MLKTAHIALFAFAVAVLAACGGGGGPSPTDTPAAVSTTPPSSNTTPDATSAAVTPSAETDAVVEAIKQDMLTRLEVTAEDIQLVSITKHDWPDACLGAAEADETCATVITPGYEIVVRVAATEYTYRTDETGGNVRFAGVHIIN